MIFESCCENRHESKHEPRNESRLWRIQPTTATTDDGSTVSASCHVSSASWTKQPVQHATGLPTAAKEYSASLPSGKTYL